MNMRTINLSVLVVTGLMLGNMPAHAGVSYKPAKKIIAVFATLALINYMLDSKESVKDPENKYKLSDLWSLNWEKTIGAADEWILGQKAKGTGVKLSPDEEKVKASSKTPATGLCGQGHAILSTMAKSSLEAGALLSVPALMLSIYHGAFVLTDKDGKIVPSIRLEKLQKWGILSDRTAVPTT